MVVAGIGAGTGYLSRRMAPAVMPGGKVWAVDEQPEMISLLQAGAERSGLTQIEAQFRREAAVFALDWERTVSTLPWQHVVMFRKRAERPAGSPAMSFSTARVTP